MPDVTDRLISVSFPSGHRDLLAAPTDQGESSDGAASSDPLPPYRAAVAEATDGFSSVSQRVLALLARIRTDPAAQECAEAVERIQELERRKLQMVSLARCKCYAPAAPPSGTPDSCCSAALLLC